MKKLALLFGMSENERKGFLLLSVLIVLIGIVPFIYRAYSKQKTDDILQLSAIVAEETKTVDQKPTETNPGAIGIPKEARAPVPFSFDPNDLPTEKWIALGFTEKQAQAIKNYEAKGGQFRTKADVAKMYVISDEDFERIAPYIMLPETIAFVEDAPKANESANRPSVATKVGETEGIRKREKTRSRVLSVVDLSIADTLSLQGIHGIGSVLASRIVKFREALGGFHTVQQVKEVYGVSEEQFVKMQSSLTVGDGFITKIDINHLSVEELAKHPYISWKDARHIVRYREQHGGFTALTDLEKMHALDEEFIRKIGPYLRLETGD